MFSCSVGTTTCGVGSWISRSERGSQLKDAASGRLYGTIAQQLLSVALTTHLDPSENPAHLSKIMDIQTQIAAVTVYPDRALVTRNGVAALQRGAQEIIVSGLPSQLQTDSLRASGRGQVAVKIIGVEARQRTLVKPNSPDARETQAELETAQDAGAAITAAMARLDGRAVTVKELAREAAHRFAKTLAQGQSDTESATHMLDYIAAQLQQIDAERAALETQKRDNAALQMALADRLKSLQNDKRNLEKIVAVLVEASEAGDWELELSYIVSNARWTPLYDARVAITQAKFTLSLNALVTQKSGENWENVALKLSTARPGVGSLPPKLEPIWVDEPRPVAAAPMMRNRVIAGKGLEMSGNGNVDVDIPSFLASSSAPDIEAQEVTTEISSEGASVEFALPHQLSVPGDGGDHRVAIAVREMPTRFEYLAIPRRAGVAYLRATATNDSPLALLAGAVSIFRDGVFVGKANLQNTAPGGELELFLGPDEQIRAERELTARETDKNFIGSSKRVHFAYEIKLENLKAQAVALEVRDQIPVSRSENIKIRLRGAAPEATQSDLGVLEWKISLAPGAKKTLRFDYGVESPRDTTVVGLTD